MKRFTRKILAGGARSSLDCLDTWLTSPGILALLVAVGAALRIINYAGDKSLWVDEALLADSIIHRSFVGLVHPLLHHQVAPLGFLWLEHAAVSLFGTSEYALRLVPLLASLAALPLFALVVRRTLPGLAAPFALGLLAISTPLLYFAAEVKQYELDACITITILLVALEARHHPRSIKSLVILAVAGALAPWLSHPSVFILAGAGCFLLYAAVRTRPWDRDTLRSLGVVFALWAASGGAALLHSFHAVPAAARAYLNVFWTTRGFLPISDGFATTVRWLGWTMGSEFTWLFPTGLSLLAVILFALGVIALFRRRDNGLDGLWLLVLAPIVFALAASALHRYPFSARLTLVYAPLFIVTAGAGLAWLAERGGTTSLARGGTLWLVLWGGARGVAPLRNELPVRREELRPLVQYLNTRRQPGDAIYVYYASKTPFLYYADRLGIPPSAYTIGECVTGDWHGYLSALDAERGKPRVWLVLSHAVDRSGVREDSLFLGYYTRIGRRLEETTAPGAAIALYNLSDTTRARIAAVDYIPPTSPDSMPPGLRCANLLHD